MNYFTDLIKQLKLEWVHLKNNINQISLCIFLMVYVASTLGRNVAYYRNVEGPRLQDIGFEIFPELPEHWKDVSEMLIYLNHIFGIGIIIVPIVYKPYQHAHSTILIGKRILTILTIGHMIRIVMYLSTSLPSPASHCQPGSTTYNAPDTWLKILFRFSTYEDKNCGDLIFSGHIFQNLSFTILTAIYSYQFFHVKIACILSWFQYINSFLQFIFIIAARNHYTIDLVVGIYVSLTIWYIYTREYPIIDDIFLVESNIV
jgi:hypothetical protein